MPERRDTWRSASNPEKLALFRIRAESLAVAIRHGTAHTLTHPRQSTSLA